MDTGRTTIFESRVGKACAFMILVFTAILFGCSMKTEENQLKIERDTIFVRDTIRDTIRISYEETVFVKNHNHESAILPVDE